MAASGWSAKIIWRARDSMTLPNPSDRYRKEATRLRDKAEVTQDPTIRTELMAIARQYDVLADAVQRPRTDQTD